jgi:membrane-bound inhibitor of C-type lysozyme
MIKASKAVAVLGLLALAACDEAPPVKILEQTALKCGNYDVAIEMVDRDTLNTAINGEKIRMNSAVSASGARYEGKGAAVSVALWNKGQNWMLIINDGAAIDCKPSAKNK